ncbi:MAG TPA: glycosyltransferase [Candidatus Kapabacteria bacterium]|nr:glycosyltransferase [Candidatus Kapabacteria bacterium]
MAAVLYITNLPTPYRIPLYRRLAEELGRRGDTFHLFFLGYARSSRSWNIAPGELSGFSHQTGTGGSVRAALAVLRQMRRRRPDVLVLAWAMDHVALLLLLAARARGITCLIVSGETPATALNNPWRMLRGIVRRPFFRLASRFLTYGTRATEYLLACGVPAARITTGINVVESVWLAGRVDALRAAGDAARERARYRAEDGSPFECHLLFVGYLHAEKGVDCCIAMMERLNNPRAVLHVVGSGPDEPMLRSMAQESGARGRILFHGYRQAEELPLFYAVADLLLVSSLVEVFGLVLVEGAAAGLPLVASRHAGGTPDVVEEGINGLTFEPADAAAFAASVARLAADPGLRARMGAASRRIAMERLTIDRSAACYIAALDELINPT